MAFAKGLFRKQPNKASRRFANAAKGAPKHRVVGGCHFSERERINLFVRFMEERRVLYAPAAHLSQRDASISVSKISLECAEQISELPSDMPAVAPLIKIETACHRFLTATSAADVVDFYVALGALRAIVAEQSEALSAIFTALGSTKADRAT